MQLVKVYPQIFPGRFRKLKNHVNFLLLLVYFGCSWIPWYRGEGTTNQALFIDLPKRRAYYFNIEIWPDEVYYITAILILSALGLFVFTSVFGRLWCGYTCPQTVFTDVFIKVETFFQGDGNARIRLDSAPLSGDKILRKSLTYLSWLGMAFLFAYGWACYFYGSRELTLDLFNGRVSADGVTWLFYLTATTYLFAGIMRERVCTYFCPYGRFQSAMLDRWTTLVTYNDWRGEPRGYKAGKALGKIVEKSAKIGDNGQTTNLVKGQDQSSDQAPNLNPEEDKKFGDCIDCGRCVNACPMGIDIRNGLQMQCIGCGLCIDACDGVMAKLGRPLGLISYDSIITENIKKRGEVPTMRHNVFRPKVFVYSTVFVVAGTILLYNLMHKPQYRILVDRERSPLFIRTADNHIRNIYNISVLNRTSKAKNLNLHITSKMEGVQFAIQQGMTVSYVDSANIELKREEEISMRIIVQVPNKQSKSGSVPLNLELSDNGSSVADKNTIFMLP